MSEPTESKREFTSAADIQVITSVEALRYRTKMYIGSTDTVGLHHLITVFVFSTALDEKDWKLPVNLEVIINSDNSCTIKTSKSILNPQKLTQKVRYEGKEITVVEKIMTVLTQLPFEGVLPNALSEEASVAIINEERNKVYWQEYKRGVPQIPLRETEDSQRIEQFGTEWVNIFRFKPDPQIFGTTEFNYFLLCNEFHWAAMLNTGVKYRLIDLREQHPHQDNTFSFENGLLSILHQLRANLIPTWNRYTLLQENPFYTTATEKGVEIEVAFQYEDGGPGRVLYFANNKIQTIPLQGFWRGLRKAIQSYALSQNLINSDAPKFKHKELQKGLVAVVSVKAETNRWTLRGLNIENYNPKVKIVLKKVLSKGFREWLEAHPDEAKRLVEGLLKNKKKRGA